MPATASRHLTIEISAANPPTLERICLEETIENKTTEIANYQPSDGGGWKVGTMSLTLYFIEAALWAMQPGSSGDFAPAVLWNVAGQTNGKSAKKKKRTPKPPTQHPYHTLAGEIAKPTWLQRVFPPRNGGSGNDVRHYFEATDGDYRDKPTGDYRRLRLRRDSLPASAVTVLRASTPLTSEDQLKVLFDDLWKQWANTNGTHEIPSQLVSLAPETAPQKVEPPTVVAIPPAIQKLLDEASKLTDDDKFAEAIPHLEKALKAAIKAKHPHAEVKARIRLSKAVFEASEDFDGCEEHCRKSLSLVGTEPSVNRYVVLHTMGDALLWAGRLDEASAVIRSSLEVARSLSDQDCIARALISVSLLEDRLGNGQEAAARLDEAILLLHQLSIGLDGEKRIKNAHGLGVCYANKAQLARNEGRPDEAVACFGKAQQQHAIANDKLNSGRVHLLLGNLHCGNGNAEEGFQCFRRAMAVFLELKNPLWMARTTKSVAKLYDQHERWEEGAKAAFTAMHGFEEAKATCERIEASLFAAAVLARLVRSSFRQNVQKQIHAICNKAPKQLQDNIAAELSAQMERVHSEIDEAVRTDEAIGELLRDAKVLAENESSYELLADCYFAEADLRIAKDDGDSRKSLLEKALDALKEELKATSVPKHKAKLMGRIGGVCRELGRKSEWATWVKRLGDIFEKTGDVYGIANFHGEMAAVHRSNGCLDEQIASYRKVLEHIEGRTFHGLAAQARVQLAEAIQLKGDFGKALHLLTEAEGIGEAHQMKSLISKIAGLRTRIEEEIEMTQAPSHSLAQLHCSLHQLVRHKPENATSYLAFWYFAWKKELLARLRSGSGLSLLVVSDDTERFMAFAGKFTNLAEHFALATSTDATVEASAKLLDLPLSWRIPSSIPLFFRQMKDGADTGNFVEESENPPNYRIDGPARQLPPYLIASGKPAICVMDTPRIPAEAIQLMLSRPIKELIQRRAVWFPYLRNGSDDPFLTDLRVGCERGLVPTRAFHLAVSEAMRMR